MTLSDEVQSLRNIPIFAKVDRAKLKLLAFTSERQRFQPGEFLVREGELGACAFIVMDGAAEVLLDTPQGPLRVAEVAKNDMVGEIALLCDMPRTASVRALTDIDTLCITKDLFFSLVMEFPEISIEVMRVLALRVEKMTRMFRESVSGGTVVAGDGI